MPFDPSTIVSLIGVLGIGSVIGQWFASSKDRTTARAAVLKELAEVEAARWYREGHVLDQQRLTTAIRQLETAALIARVPRSAVLPYVQLATAALWLVQERMEGRSDPEYATLSPQMSDLVLDAAEIVSKAAWSSPVTRWLWLRRRVRRIRRGMATPSDAAITRLVDNARRHVR